MTSLPDPGWVAGIRLGLLLGAAVLVLVLPQAQPAGPVPATPVVERRLEFAGVDASAELRRLAQWIVDSADNGDRAFAILDKKTARVYVFEPDGRLGGAAPALLGVAPGDDSVPGIGERPLAEVRPSERTTPAGRFEAQPGRNTLGEEVLWVDHAAAVSMHRVRLTDPRERRLERLASPLTSQRRISYGCINLPVDFFEQVLWPRFRTRGGIVYVLPELKPLGTVFPALAAAPA